MIDAVVIGSPSLRRQALILTGIAAICDAGENVFLLVTLAIVYVLWGLASRLMRRARLREAS